MSLQSPIFTFRIHSLPYIRNDGQTRTKDAVQLNHDLHLVHTLRGRGRLYVGDQSYETTVNNVLAIPKGVRCKWDKPDGKVWQMQNIHYSVTLDEGVPIEQVRAMPILFRPRGLASIHKTLRTLRRKCAEPLTVAATWQTIVTRYWKTFAREVDTPKVRDSEVERACELLTEHADEPFDAAWLAGEVSLSVSQMNRRFRAGAGISPQGYWQSQRVAMCRRVLGESDATLEALAPRLGFSDVYYFCRWFRKHTGQTPGRYRRASRTAVY